MPDQGDIRESIYYQINDHKIDHGEGIFVYDTAGREFLDCAAGTFNLSLGHRHPEVLATVHQQVERLVHVTSTFQTDPVNGLVRRLVDLSPAGLTKVHLKVSGGSTANEGAVKMAQVATGRSDVITLFRSHHGQTLMTTSMAGESFRKAPFPNLFPGVLHVPDPYCYRCFYREHPDTCGRLCVERINDFIDFASSGRVACIVVEPVSGSGGNIVPPDGYFSALRRLCDERGIALIFDEVQTGIGRVGRMFAAEHFAVEPDILTIGKGLGGIGMQVAAILTNERMSGLDGTYHSFTGGANVLASAAAATTLDVIARPGFLENVRKVGRQIMERLVAMQSCYPCIGDVRGLGLMIGIELVDEDGLPNAALTSVVAERGMDKGLLLRTSRYGRGNVLKIRPPLIITSEEADLLCDRLDQVFSTLSA